VVLMGVTDIHRVVHIPTEGMGVWAIRPSAGRRLGLRWPVARPHEAVMR
jgi:hypothetical protein